jgi:hypothetical protein
MSNFIGGLQSETCGRKIRRMCIIDDVTNYKGKSERKERQKDRRTTDGLYRLPGCRRPCQNSSIESELILEIGRVEFKTDHCRGLSFKGEVFISIDKLGRNSTSCLEEVYCLFFVDFHSDNHPEVVYVTLTGAYV